MTRRSRAARPLASEPLWYKDAVVYQVHVKSFFDSNNDGVGDLPGLTAKLAYIAALGATAVWLLPFYPSPRRDDGYDISDYRTVHPEYGTIPDSCQARAEVTVECVALVERDGFEPEISLAVLPNTQSELPFG